MKPGLRVRLAQLEANNTDLAARCSALEADLAEAHRTADTLRQENLQLAAELEEVQILPMYSKCTANVAMLTSKSHISCSRVLPIASFCLPFCLG